MVRHALLTCTVLFSIVFSGVAGAAEISLSLNLEFNNPVDFSSGGNWTVVAKADERGIAGIVLALENSTLNFDPSTGFLTPASFGVEQSGVFGLRLEIIQGDTLTNPTLDVGVIGGTFPSTYVDDPNLTLFGANPDLGAFSGGVELATGSFDPGDVPSWFDDGVNFSIGNLFDNAAAILSFVTVSTTVRFVAIPEPTTLFLLGLGLTLTMAARRRN